jgi:hypothetical protein
MKFKYLQILDDPRAEIENPLLIDDSILQERVPDHDLIAASLAALRDSNSLSVFYSAYIRDSKGKLHQISDCAASVRKSLEEAEEKHIGFIRNIINALINKQIKIETDIEKHQAILDLIEGWETVFKWRGASEIGLRERLINDTYLYWSYILHQALKYFKNNNKIDLNDYEDGRICLHLKLNSFYYLITDDKGMQEAVNETILLLKRLDNSIFGTTLQAANTAYLKELVMS